MSEEPTERLGERRSFEARVLTELAALGNRMGALEERMGALEERLDSLGNRLGTLEEKVDARLRETRPIWEAVLSRLDVMNSNLDVLNRYLLESRAETDLLKKGLPSAA